MTEQRRRTSNHNGGNGSDAEGSRGSSANGSKSERQGRSSAPSPAALAKRVSAELAELLGRAPEGDR